MSDPKLRAALYPPEFTSVLDLNPDLSDGSVMVFSEEMPIEFVMQAEGGDGGKVGTVDKVRLNVFKREEFGKAPILRLQVLSDADLFLHYLLVLNEQNYPAFAKSNQLNLRFDEFVIALLKLFNNLVAAPGGYLGSFLLRQNGSALLTLRQNLSYKTVDLLTLEFFCADEETVRLNIAYRYALLNAKNRYIEGKIGDVAALVRLKNPSLLAQLEKALLGGQSANMREY